MKLFFVTYRDINSTFCRAVVGQIGTKYAVATIHGGVQHGIFTEAMFKTERYSRNYDVRSRAIIGAKSVQEALEFMDNVYEVHITPLTAYQRNIIKTHRRVMFKDMLYAFYQVCGNSNSKDRKSVV